MREAFSRAWSWCGEQRELWRWIGVLLGLLALYLWLVPDCWQPASLQNFKGNLVGETVGGVIFLIVGAVLQGEINQLLQRTHELQQSMKGVQERMHDVQGEMQGVQRDMHLAQAETRDMVDSLTRHPSEQRAHLDFKRFLWRDSYFNIRIPDMPTKHQPAGLQYTIAPLKDASGRPARARTEMFEYDLVVVQSILFGAGDSAERLHEYDSAPIHLKEAYFCEFYDNHWRLGQVTGSREGQYRFELSGKFGWYEPTPHANEFLPTPLTPSDAELFKGMLISDDGIELFAGGSHVRFYRQPDGNIWVQPSRSAPARPVHVRVNEETGERQIVIPNLEGYFIGDARPRFLALVEKVVTDAGFKIPVEHERS